MIIECPACTSTYHITKAWLGAEGRRMRCAACRHIWHCTAEDSEVPAPEDALAQRLSITSLSEAAVRASADDLRVEASSDRALPPSYEEVYGQRLPRTALAARRLRPNLPLPSRGMVVVALVIAAGMAAVGFRDRVVAAVPAANLAYTAIHLPVNPLGLALENVTSTIRDQGSHKVLAVTGEISNLRRHHTNVPPLRISVRGADGRNLYAWLSYPGTQGLASGQHMSFKARLASPPHGAHDVAVNFATGLKETAELTQ
ncbi:MAG: zinc-ribbon domain-containing protein [Hyphomicrobiales bacterium]|nr:zinc-ribbon domain-containing protein [Hyphomicrobiales bacterium]